MTRDEGRMSRWLRLKRRGGASPEEDAAARTDKRGGAKPVAVDGSAAVEHRFAPPMPALADPEEGETAYEAAPADAPVRAADEAGDADPDEERELTPEEQEVVDALPPIENLTKDSDFTPFMAERVPEFIRRRALRVLWRSDPVLANLDGLNDYDEDFRIIDKLIAAADSAYKAGKGYVTGDGEEAVETDGREAVTAAAEPGPGDDDEVGDGEDDGEDDDETSLTEAPADVADDDAKS